MALEPKFKLLDDVAGDVIFVEDDTGVYEANNTGGWGDPNQERNELALLVYAERLTDEGNVIAPLVTDQVVWNAGLANNDVSSFQITVPDTDGIFDIYMFAIKVSTDGINDLESNPLEDGDIVFYENQVQERVSGELVVLTEDQYLSKMNGNDDIPQFYCQEIVFPNAQIKYGIQYKEYVQKIKEGCENTDQEFADLSRYVIDIYGMDLLHKSALPSQARGVLESLHNRYE